MYGCQEKFESKSMPQSLVELTSSMWPVVRSLTCSIIHGMLYWQ